MSNIILIGLGFVCISILFGLLVAAVESVLPEENQDETR